jgi:hypothetical protein
MPWPKVYESYSSEFGYGTGTTTKIGNLGDFVVFPDTDLTEDSHIAYDGEAFTGIGKPLPRRLSHLTFLPGAHIPSLLRAHAGDILKLNDPNMREHVLYQVREVYEGGVPNTSLERTRRQSLRSFLLALSGQS